MKLTTKVVGSLLLLALVTLVVFSLEGWISYLLKGSLSNLAKISEEVDMTMNEEIIIPAYHASLFFYKYLKSGKEAHFQETEKALRQLEESFPRWKEAASTLVPSARAEISTLEDALRQMKRKLLMAKEKEESFEKGLEAIEKELDSMTAYCEQLMETVIDPAKERANTLKALSYWSEVDMVMNEDITQNLLHLRIALKDGLRTGDLKPAYEKARRLEAGIKAWAQLVQDNPQLKGAAKILLDYTARLYDLLDQASVVRSQEVKLLSQVDQSLKNFLDLSDRLMSTHVDPALEAIIKRGEKLDWLSQVALVLGGVLILGALLVVWMVNQRFLEFVRLSIESFSEFERLNLLIKPEFKKLDPNNPRDVLDQAAAALLKFTSTLRKTLKETKEETVELSSQEKTLSVISEALHSSAQNISSKADEMSSATERVREVIQNVADSMDEMNKAIEEISRHTSHTSTIADQAAQETLTAKEIMHQLAGTLSKINEMNKVIVGIAEQTNLLALNATIEAARAGEAGKGFAVVANEVKELARQARENAGRIEEIVKEITENSERALSAMENITGVIEELTENAKSIAAAVEEQTAVTSEVYSRAETAREETQRFEEATKVLFDYSADFKKEAEELFQVSEKLKKTTQFLTEKIGQFKV